MILRTHTGNRESRDAWSQSGIDAVPAAGIAGGMGTYAGRRVNKADAMALPAALAAIRLLSETIGYMPLKVYSTDAEGDREAQPDAPQSMLLNRKPNSHQTPFQVVSYLIASLNGVGGALLLKTKDRRGRVQELYPLHSDCWYPKREGGELVFKYRVPPETKETTLTRADVIYIPGVLISDPLIGVSPITAHRNALGTILAVEEYGGRFFANDATPGGIITHPTFLKKEQRDQIREGWEARHRGTVGSHRVGILVGGAEFKQIGVNLQDAQFIDAQRYGVQEIARIFRVPADSIGGQNMAEARSASKTPEARNLDLLSFSLMPWIARVEQALHADDDLFPDKSLYPEFLTDAILRADTVSRYQAYLPARQAGWVTANEIRRWENLPSVDGGDDLQQTPVGGAPNAPAPPPATEPAPLQPGAASLHLHVPKNAINVDARTTSPPINVDARTTVEAPPVPQVDVRNEVKIPKPSETHVSINPELTFEMPEREVPAKAVRYRVERDEKGNMTHVESVNGE